MHCSKIVEQLQGRAQRRLGRDSRFEPCSAGEFRSIPRNDAGRATIAERWRWERTAAQLWSMECSAGAGAWRHRWLAVEAAAHLDVAQPWRTGAEMAPLARRY